ncbi:MAG TPA: hypothetical protein V6C72_10440, partial [Chroococcales cyanobacterium]
MTAFANSYHDQIAITIDVHARSALPGAVAVAWALVLVLGIAVLVPTGASAGPLDMLKFGKSEESAAPRSTTVDSYCDAVNYKLTFDLDLKSGTLKTTGDIDIRIRRELNKVLLTGFNQHLHDVFISDQYAETGSDVKEIREASDGTVTLNLVRTLSPGNFILHFQAEPKLSDEQTAFFRSRVTDAAGSHYIAQTEVGSRYGGVLFPYLGKPRSESTFEISCLVDKDLEVISNSAVSSVENQDDKKLVHFR